MLSIIDLLLEQIFLCTIGSVKVKDTYTDRYNRTEYLISQSIDSTKTKIWSFHLIPNTFPKHHIHLLHRVLDTSNLWLNSHSYHLLDQQPTAIRRKDTKPTRRQSETMVMVEEQEQEPESRDQQNISCSSSSSSSRLVHCKSSNTSRRCNWPGFCVCLLSFFSLFCSKSLGARGLCYNYLVHLDRLVFGSGRRSSFVKLCMINGVGPLIARQLIHVMAMVGFIPARFAADAALCETTSTYKRLEQRHNLSKGQIPTLIAISLSFSRTEYNHCALCFFCLIATDSWDAQALSGA